MTKLRAERPGFNSRNGKELRLVTASRPALGPTRPPLQWVPEALSPAVKRRSMKLTTRLNLESRLKIHEAIPPLPYTSS